MFSSYVLREQKILNVAKIKVRQECFSSKCRLNFSLLLVLRETILSLDNDGFLSSIISMKTFFSDPAEGFGSSDDISKPIIFGIIGGLVAIILFLVIFIIMIIR